MTITTGGSVGINTTSPDAPLHIYGTTVNTTAFSGTGSDSCQPYIRLEANPASDCDDNDYNPILIDFRMSNQGGHYTNIARIGAVMCPEGGSGHNTVSGENSNALIFCTTYGNNNGNALPTERMRINHKGNVGISTTAPKTPLDVRGSTKGADIGAIWTAQDNANLGTTSPHAAGQDDGAWVGMSYLNGWLGTWNSNQGYLYEGDLKNTTDENVGIQTIPVSIHSQHSVYVSDGGVLFSSDERIKCNIKNLDDKLALEIIRKIETKTYNYIDYFSRGTKLVVGFIAQNVAEHYPTAVKFVSRFIPNILKQINVSWQSFTENNETKYKMSTTDLTEIFGITYRFYVANLENYSDNEEIEVVGNSDNTFKFDKKYKYVFCYGKEIDDFHSLDKDKIFTLYHSAIQELDRQQIADKERITNLETKVNTLEIANQQQQTKINILETENAELKSIIDKLKTANSFEDFKNSL